MDYLEFDEKLKIKEFVEKKIYIKEKNREKINLLKGSLSIKNKEKVEKLLNDKKYYYESQGEEKEARSFCIGKAIVILNKERNIIKEFISLNLVATFLLKRLFVAIIHLQYLLTMQNIIFIKLMITL